MKKIPEPAQETIFLVPPEDLTLVQDEAHPLYDPRSALPLDESLVLSIIAYGIKQAVLIHREDSQLVVVDGLQRVRAALEANRRLSDQGGRQIEVPVKIEQSTDLYGVKILVNEQRQDDSLIAKAEKLRRYLALGRSKEQAAIVFGLSLEGIRHLIKLLSLVPEVQAAVDEGKLPLTAAVRLARLPQEEQASALSEVAEGAKGGVVRSVLRAVHRARGGVDPKALPSRKQICRLLDTIDDDEILPRGVRDVLTWVATGEVRGLAGRLLEIAGADWPSSTPDCASNALPRLQETHG